MRIRRMLRLFKAAACLLLMPAGTLLSTTPVAADPYRYYWGHPTPQGNTVYGMAFASAEEGWAVGGGGFVLRTLNGGESWSLQHGLLAFAPDLYDIVLTPDGSLIACGAGEAIFRSVDGGATWSTPAHPPATDLRDLCIAPDGAISAAGVDGNVLRSADDGVTWTSIGPGIGTIRHHTWRTATESYVVGPDVSHRTTDGGTTWNEFIPIEFAGYNEVYFATPTEGYVHADFGYWKSTDAGATWDEIFTAVAPLYRYRTLVLGPQHWLLVCHGEGAELWETTDAGANWTLLQYRVIVGYPCVVQAPGGRVLFGSDAGDLFYTDDLGQTIENATQNFSDDLPGAPMEAVYARPDGVVFAANQPNGGEPCVWLRSDDAGMTWTRPAQTPLLNQIFGGGFFDNQRGIVGGYGQIRATFDGGASWQSGSGLPAGYNIFRAALPAADRYFVTTYRDGGGGGVFRSTDGGLSWNPVGGGLPQGSMYFWDIAFPTPTIGYTTASSDGSQPFLYKTTDGGVSWQLLSVSGITSMIRTMVWFDAQTGVVSPGWQDPDMHRTTDGGLTWTPVGSDSFLNFKRRDSREALALTAYLGYFLRTTDAGATWEVIDPPLSGAFPEEYDHVGAAAPVPNGWVLGGSRNRLVVAEKTSPADASDPGTPPGLLRVGLTAEPNPLTLATILNLNNPVAGPVSLDIFDSRGARVATLVDSELPAGSHAVAWNGKDDQGRSLPGGSYFARVRTAAGHGTAKLTVIK